MSDTEKTSTEEKPFVLTPEIYERAMKKLGMIENEVEKMTGKPCRIMSMLNSEKVKEMKKMADDYKRENPDWQTEGLSQSPTAWPSETNKVEEID